jgi:hypothetical protein
MAEPAKVEVTLRLAPNIVRMLQEAEGPNLVPLLENLVERLGPSLAGRSPGQARDKRIAAAEKRRQGRA